MGPDGEVGGVEGVLLLDALDDGLVLEEEDGAVAGGEAAVDLALGRPPLVGGDDGLERVEDDLPELLVLVPEEEDGLSNERGGASVHASRGRGRGREGVRTRLDWELKEEGACLTAVATISSILASGMVVSEEMV